MLKPSYIFLWIIFHITAVELPNKIKERGTPKIPVTELVQRNQYVEAITKYKNLKKVKEKAEWFSLASAFDRLGYVDTAEILIQRMFRRFPSKIKPADKLFYAELLRKQGKFKLADSIIVDLKSNTEYAAQAIYSQYANVSFLKAPEHYSFLNVELQHFRSLESNDIYGLVKSPKNNQLYFHERQAIYSGLINNRAQSDNKPYGRVKALIQLKDTVISNSVLFPKQLWNRHLDLNEIDKRGNYFVTVNNSLVNDDDKFLLNVRLMKYDTGRSKVVFEEIGFDKLSYNTSNFAISPSQNTCVFSSDLTGTLGMADLHIGDLVYKDDGDIAVENYYNLGEVVNTIKGEYDAAFITDQIILFSSDGHSGFGSKDIYVYHLVSNKLMNLGSQINSRFDEITPKFIDSFLYFSSNRISNIYDIFRCKLNIQELENCLNPPAIVGDYNNKLDSVQASMFIISDPIDEVKSLKQIRKRLLDEDPRKYNYTRGVDFLLANDSVRLKLIDEIDSTADYRDFKFLTLSHPSDDIVIELEYENELKLLLRILQKRPDWAILIRSHTDSKGTSRSNLRLSAERAGFIGDYLRILGVSPEQIITEGLGEAYPLNHCFDEAPCTEQELAKNRRTELILIQRPD